MENALSSKIETIEILAIHVIFTVPYITQACFVRFMLVAKVS